MLRFWIRRRHSWLAQPPKKITYDNWRKGVTLVVHHTAGYAPRNENQEIQEMRSIQRQHKANGWDDIGYNYVIMPSGRVYEGRGFNIVGAHTYLHNTGTIGVSFAGNYDVTRPTRAQLIAFKQLRRWLRKRGARVTKIRGHKQMPNQATACPGRFLMRSLNL